MWDTIWQTLASGDVITALILAILGVIITIVKVILFPLGLILQAIIPPLDDGLAKIAELFDYAGTYLSWTFSLLAIPTEVIIFVTAYYSAILTITISVWSFKLGILWWRAIK